MASWVFSLNANRMVVIHSQKWCLSLYRIREWFGKVTDKFVSRKIFQKFSVYLHFRSPVIYVFPRLLRPRLRYTDVFSVEKESRKRKACVSVFTCTSLCAPVC